MPIYAYRCESCGVRKDVLQKVSDAPLTTCTECGAPAFRKELSAPAFQLKGSGWYVTDFRDNGKPKDKSEAKGAEAAGNGAKADGGDTPSPAASSGADAASKSGSKNDTGGTASGGTASAAPASGSSASSSSGGSSTASAGV
jgi:putative FmdB family regulatory protein